MISILYAMGSTFTFAIASLYFTEFSKKVSPVWMNYMKACVAFVCFCLTILIFQIPFAINQGGVLLLVASGITGLMIGDIFLMSAFAHLGSGRVLMIFGLQPLILGVSSYFLFNDHFEWHRLIAVIFFILCIFSFSLESFKEKGDWELKGILFALAGVLLDAFGVLMTKKAFETNPELSPFLANAIRSGTTAIGFFLVSLFLPRFVQMKAPFLSLSARDKKVVIFASALGTYGALSCYLKAIQIGHLATISAIAGTSPLFATVFEIIKGRKKMTGYLAFAICSFIIGFVILFNR